MPCSKSLTSKNFIGDENKRSDGDSGNSNSNAGSYPGGLLSPDTNAPLSHEFRMRAFSPHLESWHHRFRWLLGTFYRVCFLQARSNFLKRGGFLLKCHSFSWRFRKTLPGHGKRFFDIIDVEPLLGAKVFQYAVLP